jgi:hypothetical protein
MWRTFDFFFMRYLFLDHPTLLDRNLQEPSLHQVSDDEVLSIRPITAI